MEVICSERAPSCCTVWLAASMLPAICRISSTLWRMPATPLSDQSSVCRDEL
ncbi:hypothetical protein D3C85_1932000 [compost metagenome]